MACHIFFFFVPTPHTYDLLGKSRFEPILFEFFQIKTNISNFILKNQIKPLNGFGLVWFLDFFVPP